MDTLPNEHLTVDSDSELSDLSEQWDVGTLEPFDDEQVLNDQGYDYVSDIDTNDGEDAADIGREADNRGFFVEVEEKLVAWGALDKDWSAVTRLEEYFRTKEQKGILQLKDLVDRLEQGMTIEEFESRIPPTDVTKFYCSTKNDLKRLAGKEVILLIGFCPQYNLTLEGDCSQVEPGDSECLT